MASRPGHRPHFRVRLCPVCPIVPGVRHAWRSGTDLLVGARCGVGGAWFSYGMEAGAETREALVAVLAATPRFRTVSDAELLAETEAWEALGRLVDARRIAAAAEVEHRSRDGLGEQSLAFRHGRKDGPDLVSALGRVSHREAKRRIGLGAALAPRLSLGGDDVPGRYPAVAAAVSAGELGLESARIVLGTLQSARKRASGEALAAAEAGLTESGCETTPDLLRVHATVWRARIDPDGAEPSEAEQRRQRAFRFGRVGFDGVTAFSGAAQPEMVALVKAAFQAHGPQGPMLRTVAGGVDTEDLEPQWLEAEGELRTKAQRDYDTFFSLFAAGVRSEQDGTGASLRTPHEVIVHVTAADAAARRGQGWAEGVTARLSIPTVERIACSGGTRILVSAASGEPLHLGRAIRLFSRAQKKALAARYGGCAWPGCTAPVSWTEAHHIAWWTRDEGLSNIDNGVLLCTHHHHLIHATDPQFRIVVQDHEPHLVPRAWHGPPQPRHRMQRHPSRLLPPPGIDDPWLGQPEAQL
jgi:hypothetical protein